MSRSDRFRLKSRILDEFESPGDLWSFDRTNLVLDEFDLPTRESYHDPLADCLTGVPDDVLVELAAVVLGVEESEVVDSVESGPDDAGTWRSGYLRVFLSHSASRKAEVSLISDELAVVGIHGFVAHDAMAYSEPWQAQIEEALRTMQALVILVHPELNDSAWCHQEIGWALGRRVPVYAVRIGADPKGFIARDQWPSVPDGDPKAVAAHISTWVSTLPGLGDRVVEGLIRALGEAGNYYDAEAAAERIAALGTLTPEQFRLLDETWWSNNQAYGGYLPTQVMAPFYRDNGRSWPPPKPEPEDEEPF